MKILESRKLDLTEFNAPHDAYFVRIDPENLSLSVLDILKDLANMSWLNDFDKDFLRDSFESRAKKTCEHLKSRLIDTSTGAPIVNEAGEYIVSSLAKKALVIKFNHKDIPLTELIGRKITNNPGFDFYTEKSLLIW